MLGAALIVILIGTLSTVRAVIAVKLERSLGQELMSTTVNRLFSAEYRYFERRNIGDLLVRVTTADGIRDMLLGGITSSVLSVATSLGYFTAVIVLSPPLAGVTAVLAVAEAVLLWHFGRRAGQAFREEVAARSVTQTHIASAVAGIAVVRATGGTKPVRDRWATAFATELRAYTRRSSVAAGADVLATISGVALPLVLVATAWHFVASSPGQAVATAVLAMSAVSPIVGLSSQLFALSSVQPAVEQLDDVWTATAESDTGIHQIEDFRGAIELCNVSFRYDKHADEALRDANIRIEPGTKVVITGRSGSGKSTLVKLLTGLRVPTDGKIMFDGYPIGELDLDSLRRHVGVVMQGSYPPIGTIDDTIRLAHPDATQDEVEAAARLAAIHDDIMDLPLGYKTQLGGISGLSGGQLQRISLAQALVGHPRILVLDEATSALDDETESVIEENLRRLHITRVVVAHRQSTMSGADQIIRLEHGTIIADRCPENV